jgi:TRAP-type mannitol/chloroaromatic compound transport system substrate-binding protein
MIANEADGVKNMVWPDEILDQLRAAWDEVVQEEIASNPDAQKLWASYTEFNAKYKVWGDRGYLK